MQLVLPDTNVVIGRIKEGDGLHSACIDALGEYPQNSVRLLAEVHKEALATLQKHSSQAINNIRKANAESLLSGDAVADLTNEKLDRIMRRAAQLSGGRHEGFYEGIHDLMRGWLADGENPLLHLDKILTNTVRREQRDLNVVFGITDPLKQCILYSGDEISRADAVREILRGVDPFFDDDKNSRDLKIAAQALVVGERADVTSIVLVICDGEFHDALDKVRLKPPTDIHCAADKMSLRRVGLVR